MLKNVKSVDCHAISGCRPEIEFGYKMYQIHHSLNGFQLSMFSLEI